MKKINVKRTFIFFLHPGVISWRPLILEIQKDKIKREAKNVPWKPLGIFRLSIWLDP